MTDSHSAMPVRVLAIPLQVWLPDDVPEKTTEDGPSICVSAIHERDLDGTAGSCLA